MNAVQAAEIVNSTDLECSPHGSECIFVNFGDGWGIKIFDEKKNRNAAHAMQKAAEKFDLGPSTGDKVDIASDQFGYITEVVEVMLPTALSSTQPLTCPTASR